MKKSLFAAALMSLFLAACGQAEKATEAAASAASEAVTEGTGRPFCCSGTPTPASGTRCFSY